MPSKDALTISLTPELNAFIHAQVASGRYHTASEVVRAGLRLLTRFDPPSSLLLDPADFLVPPEKPVRG